MDILSPALSLRRIRVLAIAWYVRRVYLQTEKACKKIRQENQRTALWSATHARLARMVREQMVKLQGVWIKLGQFLSTQEVLPEPWRDELAQLQDKVPPRPPSEIRRTLQEEFRSTSSRTLLCCRRAASAGNHFGPFAYFAWSPIASASIAQVHKATLQDGREVAVKIQHRGISDIMNLDISLVKQLMGWVTIKESKHMFDFRVLLEDWCKETKKELDFLHEAENAERVAAKLAADPKVRVKVPAVVRQPDLLAPRRKVLVLEYIDGVKPQDIQTIGANPQQVLHDLAAIFARQLFHDGLFHGDPHPGNILVERRSHLPTLLDFGLTKEVTAEVRVMFARVVVAIATGDRHGLLVALKDLDLVKDDFKDPTPAIEAAKRFFLGKPSKPAADSIAAVPDCGSKIEAPQTTSVPPTTAAPATTPALTTIPLPPTTVAPTTTAMISDCASSSERPVASLGASGDHIQLNMDVSLDQRQPLPAQLDWKLVGSRYPVEATPGSFIFVLRVISCLRGIATSMGLSFDAVTSFYPSARQAIKRAACARWSEVKLCPGKGLAPPAQMRLAALIGQLLEQGQLLGISAAVYSGGTLLASCAAGDLGPADTSPVTEDTLFGAFSCGSVVGALLVHCLVDSGDLALDARVVKYWDQFRCHSKDNISVRELLEHRAGLSACTGRARSWHGVAPLEELCRWDTMVDRLAQAKRTEASGGAPRFHALSHGWLCSALADRVTCTSYPVLIQERITDPLGLGGQLYPMLPPESEFSGRLVAFGVDDHLAQQWPSILRPSMIEENLLQERLLRETMPADDAQLASVKQQNLGIAAQLLTSPLNLNDQVLQRALLPAVNTRCTALGLATIFAALAGDGAVVGHGRLLSEKYCRWLQQEIHNVSDSETILESWPLGFHQMRFRSADGSIRRGAFGAFALGGCLVFSDPATNTAAAILVNELSKEAGAVKALLRLLAELLPDLGECLLDGRDGYDCLWWEKPYDNGKPCTEI